MARSLLALGILVTLVFLAALTTMAVAVGGEEDWTLGIALVLCILGCGVLGACGAIASGFLLWRRSDHHRTAVGALVLNLIPALFVAAAWLRSTML